MESSSQAAQPRVLVVEHKTSVTQPLLDAVSERARRGPCSFTLLVPNTTHGLHKVVDPNDQGAGEDRGAEARRDEADELCARGETSPRSAASAASA